jgi:hypothetical protein
MPADLALAVGAISPRSAAPKIPVAFRAVQGIMRPVDAVFVLSGWPPGSSYFQGTQEVGFWKCPGRKQKHEALSVRP